MQYGTLLNFLDNYCLTVVITVVSSNYCLKYWKGYEFCSDLFNVIKNHLNIIDESVVEIVHSVIRQHTTEGASEKTLADTMKAIFGCGPRQENFRSTFTPAHNYVFSRIQLRYLHTRVAKLLVSIFSKISSNPDESYSLPRSIGQHQIALCTYSHLFLLRNK